MVPGSWIRGPFPVSFFVLSVFSRLSFLSYERVNCPGWGSRFHLLCLDTFFLRSSYSLVLPFLALVRADPAMAGFR